MSTLVSFKTRLQNYDGATFNDIFFEKLEYNFNRFSSVSFREIFDDTRTHDISHARWILQYVFREGYKISYMKLAYIFNLDHTTVMHGNTKVASRRSLKFKADAIILAMRSKDIKNKIISYMHKNDMLDFIELPNIEAWSETLEIVNFILLSHGQELAIKKAKGTKPVSQNTDE